MVRMAVVAFAVGSLLMGGTAAPAQAVEAPVKASVDHTMSIQAGGKCQKTKLCQWTKTHRKGRRYTNHFSNHGCIGLASGAARSASNQSGRTVRFYNKRGCAGSSFKLTTGHYVNVSRFKIHSFRFL